MKYFTAVAVLALALSCEAATNCHWGPSYWCQSETTARECGGTEYCQENVWEKQSSNVGGLECDLCEKLLEFVDGKLTDNSTEAQIKQALEEFCNSTGPLQSTCSTFVDQYFDEIWQLLVNDGLDPDEVCSKIGLCSTNAQKAEPRPLESEPSNVGDFKCDVCQEVVEFVDKELLNNETEDEVKQAVEEFCQSLGPLGSLCTDFVDNYFDEIWQLLMNEVSPDEVCSKIGLCSSKALRAEPRPSRVKGNVVSCVVCKMVAKEFLNLIDTNVTKSEAQAEIKKVCVFMGGLAGECRTLITDFFPELWEAAFAAAGDPEKVCELMTLCPDKVSMAKMLLAKPKVSLPKADICDLCKLAATFLKQYVDDNSTEAEVKDALESLCALLPGNASSECNGLIDQYFDLIWDLLKEEVDSGDICNQIGLCNSTASVTSLKSKPRPLPLPRAPTQDLCDLCKLAATFLKQYVDSNATEDEVKAIVKQVCDLLPSGVKDECSSLVDQYFDLIWDLVKQEVDSGDICKQIGLCNSTQLYRKKVKVSDGDCDACKEVVKYLRDVMDNNMTEDAAKAAIEAVCTEAGPLKDECTAIVEQYFPMIWKLLASYVDDDQICSEIKLCNSSASVLASAIKVQVAKTEKVGGGVFCMVCEFVMKELVSMLDGNTTKQAIEDALDKVCSELPSTISTDCTEFVDKYGPEIIDLILSGTAGKAVCTALGLCILPEKDVLTEQGTEECTVCKLVLEAAKTLIGSKTAEDDVSKALEDVCDVVPSGIESECKMFVETFGPQLIQLLSKAIDPATICRDIKLCTSNARLHDMLAPKY